MFKTIDFCKRNKLLDTMFYSDESLKHQNGASLVSFSFFSGQSLIWVEK